MGVTLAPLQAALERIGCEGHRSSQEGIPRGPRTMAVITIFFVDGGDLANVVESDGHLVKIRQIRG